MKRKHKRILLAGVVLAIVGLIWWSVGDRRRARYAAGPMDSLALLLPDDARLDDPRITIWLDAGKEQGLHLRPVKASEFLRDTSAHRFAGVVVPDKVHQAMSDEAVEGLRRYVGDGGSLFLTFDAGTWTPQKFYAHGKSRLSDIAGVDYAMYEELREKVVAQGPVFSTSDALAAMDIPPGKFMKTDRGKVAGAAALTLVGYKRDFLTYPYFATASRYRGTPLLTSPDGLVAGVNPMGAGKVLFVNLPLGYLAGRTDGMMLHAFLKYFSERVLTLPRLAAVPDGIGGLVMNWHVDSNADIKHVLEHVKRLGFYEQKPYSIHVTAGPDTRAIGDGLGVNVPQNRQIQAWLRSISSQGHAVGSHGGWIHDYFGKNLTTVKTPQFESFLRLNKQALEKATGKPVLEYSAPQGNQPPWATSWLAERGVLAFYFTGNTGMAPTRAYRDSVKVEPKHNIWAFPVTNLGMSGSFEEISDSGLKEADVEKWLREMTRFAALQHVSRLIYFHPNGTRLYPQAVKGWLAQAKSESAKGHFRWYTMTRLAQFLIQREKVQWNVVRDAKGTLLFDAKHPASLRNQAWLLPKDTYSEPKIVAGKGTVQARDAYWVVAATDGKSLRFSSSG